jgi:hypothetical protein
VKFEYARTRLRSGDLKGFAVDLARGFAQAARYRKAIREARTAAQA